MVWRSFARWAALAVLDQNSPGGLCDLRSGLYWYLFVSDQPALDYSLPVVYGNSALLCALTTVMAHWRRHLSGREGCGEVPGGVQPAGAEAGARAAQGEGGGGEEGCVR